MVVPLVAQRDRTRLYSLVFIVDRTVLVKHGTSARAMRRALEPTGCGERRLFQRQFCSLGRRACRAASLVGQASPTGLKGWARVDSRINHLNIAFLDAEHRDVAAVLADVRTGVTLAAPKGYRWEATHAQLCPNGGHG